MAYWLITWEWRGDRAKVREEEKIACILNYRLSGETVRGITELLYVNSQYNLGERLSYAKNKQNNPYPAELELVEGGQWLGSIQCGHNPWLHARMVEDLGVVADESSEERLTWKERPKPDFSKFKD